MWIINILYGNDNVHCETIFGENEDDCLRSFYKFLILQKLLFSDITAEGVNPIMCKSRSEFKTFLEFDIPCTLYKDDPKYEYFYHTCKFIYGGPYYSPKIRPDKYWTFEIINTAVYTETTVKNIGIDKDRVIF